MRIDPAPGKDKSLVIRYVYRDAVRIFVVTGRNRASYAALSADAAEKIMVWHPRAASHQA